MPVQLKMDSSLGFDLAPLSFEQERIWLLEQLGQGGCAYHVCQGVEIRGTLDVRRLEHSLQSLMDRHEILRTSFVFADGRPQQRIATAREWRAPVHTLSLPEESVIRFVRQPFDLENEPAWRIGILSVSNDVQQMIWCMHEIICDREATLGILLSELLALHRGDILPAPTTQYREYVHWQRATWTDEYLAPYLSYWKTRSSNVSSGLQLPTDRPRSALQTHSGDSARHSLPNDIVELLACLEEQGRTSADTVLCAAFFALLHRYARQPDITIGYEVSRRKHAPAMHQVGQFGNLLALSVRMDDHPTSLKLFDRVSRLFVEAEANADLPFQKLVESLVPHRDPSMPPLIQVSFSSREGQTGLYSQTNAPASGLQMTLFDVPTGSVAYELTLTIERHQVGFDHIWEWNTELFDRDTVQYMVRHFEVLVRGMLRNPEQEVGLLPILTDSELFERMNVWNSVDPVPYRRVCIHQLFEEQVLRTPDAIALEFEGTRLCYAELNERANRLAHYLQKKGVGPNMLVGICMERSLEIIIAVVGILKAGGAYVPLDAAYPEERLRYMLTDSQASVVLTTAKTLNMAPHVKAITADLHLLALDSDWSSIAHESPQNPTSSVQPDDVAYCIYTSGSTGQPKGGLMEHGALANLMAWHKVAWLSEVGTRILLFSPISFDVSFHEIAGGLCTGGTLVQLREEIRRNALALLDFIMDQRIEKMYVPFIALQQLAQAALERGVTKTPVREVLVSGEPLKITDAIARVFNQTGCIMHNQYGATECQVATVHTLVGGSGPWPVHVPIGKPTVFNTRVYVLDEHMQHVPIGVIGEIYTDSHCLARGYLRRPELTAERFLQCPFTPAFGKVLYRFGDLGRYQKDGTIECLGRSDHQVKIRGFRVELGEIEAALMTHPEVAESVVMPREDVPGNRLLVGYVVANRAISKEQPRDAFAEQLRDYLAQSLPEYMVPAKIVILDKMPLTPSGKVDRRGLPAPDAQRKVAPTAGPKNDVERCIVEVFQEVLRIENVSTRDNFFELGGNSLLIVAVHRKLADALGRAIPTMALFQYPTIAALAEHLQDAASAPAHAKDAAQPEPSSQDMRGAIAIIGAACRFPGATDVDTFWKNIRDGRESLQTFLAEELEVGFEKQNSSSRRILVGGVLSDIESFDAGFFGMSSREAALMDPQQRLLFECAWEAFETAGYSSERHSGDVGVYLGAGLSTYLANHVLPACGFPMGEPMLEDNSLALRVGSDRNYFPTRISYKLNLTGPSMAVQTACSTSLVAVHQACQAIRAGDCDIALAGGAAITVPQRTGYAWEEGMFRAPDGHCRAFDADAGGTVFSNGVGLVLLKPLERAIADGDTIWAVIRGSAVNNDGSRKVGFFAPSVDRQAAVIRKALDNAGVSSASIGYVEAHGTATVLGDPIEITALTQAFGHDGISRQTKCAIGSVKTNIGHTDEAAGIAGLLKTVMALRHRQIPPSLHFDQPNPHIDFDRSPFYVNTQLQNWPTGRWPRRAGVSAFAMGGTNCHVIVEEAPELPRQSAPSAGPLPFVLSAQSRLALQQSADRFAQFLDCNPGVNLVDLCFTMATGRKHFPERLATIVPDVQSLRERLAQFARGEDVPGLQRMPHVLPNPNRRKIAFLFTGQGSQYPGMGRALFDTQPVFRQTLLRCEDILRGVIDRPLCEILFEHDQIGANRFVRTEFVQPALVALELALAELWKSWGVIPDVVLGHSLGEYVAACVAGVLTLEDTLHLVAIRGKLMGSLPENGAMVSVLAPLAKVEEALAPYSATVSIAAINAPERIVISGLADHLEALAAALSGEGIEAKRLDVSHAFHSQLMAPVVAQFGKALQQVDLRPPRIPVVSNVTGKVGDAEFSRAEYWLSQMRQPVQFAASMNELMQLGVHTLVEIGPKPVLLGLGRQCLPLHDGLWLPSLRANQNANEVILDSLATLHVHGHPIDWPAFVFDKQPPRRIPLPTYPFQRERHWIEAPNASWRPQPRSSLDWLYDIVWKQLGPVPSPGLRVGQRWQIIAADELGDAVSALLLAHDQTVEIVKMSATDLQDPGAAVRAVSPNVDGIIYLPAKSGSLEQTDVATQARTECIAALHLIQATSALSSRPRLWLVTQEAQPVLEREKIDVSRAPLWSLARTLRNEQPEMSCHCIDIEGGERPVHDVARELLALLSHSEAEIAIRRAIVHAPRLRPSELRAHSAVAERAPLSSGGKYLITGGLGGLGLRLAEHLAARGAKQIILAGRRGAVSVEAQEVVRRLHESGVVVTVFVGNVGNLEDARAMVQAGSGPLLGVFHLAGVLDDGILPNLTGARIAKIMEGKVAGAWNLHQVTLSMPLDFFVMFSSDTALLGHGGQGNYASANAVLDALAHHRRYHGLPALSMNWGSWGEIGMAMALSPLLQDRMKSQGLIFMPVAEGLRHLDLAMSSSLAQVAVLPMDWPAWLRQYRRGAEPALLREIAAGFAHEEPVPANATGKAQDAGSDKTGSQEFEAVLLDAPVELRRGLLEQRLRKTIGEVLGASAGAALALQQGFFAFGLDSLTSIELRNLLQIRLGVSLAQTVLFTHSNLEQLINYLMTKVFVHAFPPRTPEVCLETPMLQISQQLANMSEVEAEALLERELEKLGT